MLLRAREAWRRTHNAKNAKLGRRRYHYGLLSTHAFFSTSVFNACALNYVYSLSKIREFKTVIAIRSRTIIKKFLWTQIQQTIDENASMHCVGNLHPSLQLHNSKGTYKHNLLQVLHFLHYEIFFRLLVHAKAFRWPFKNRTRFLKSTFGRGTILLPL